MEFDPATTTVASVLAATVAFLLRKAWQRLELVILAAAERSRIRNGRRTKSVIPPRRPQTHEEFAAEETTDIHELIDLERNERARRKTDRQSRRGERPPRPGTHHDRED